MGTSEEASKHARIRAAARKLCQLSVTGKVDPNKLYIQGFDPFDVRHAINDAPDLKLNGPWISFD